ncbi:MAG: hypothetical protein ISS57_06650 [Anaerolineales bacterium]|nr:hypothetical protein [Anaerolineales bacterium]
MRTFEIILTALLAIRITLGWIPLNRGRWHEGISFAALGVMGVHLGFEGYRWQMTPLYAVTLGMSIGALRQLTRPKESARPRWGSWITLGMLTILIISILPPILAPIPQTPPPTGPYPVGTFSLMLVDESRVELYSADPGEPRAIMAQVW